MAEISTCPSIEPASVQKAHLKIREYIHHTPLITCRTLDAIASHPFPESFSSRSPPNPFTAPEHIPPTARVHCESTPSTDSKLPTPKFNLYFKCENQQKIGAFKARGAFNALTHLIEELGLEELRKRGVTTHSSGNHAQALALAAHTFGIPSHIVMPTISTPSKIAGTRMYTDNVIFSGSTSVEREAKVEEVIRETGAILVPPYDHPDIMLGQGTAGYEMETQFQELKQQPSARFDAVLTPLGGGGLLSGTATWFSHTSSPTSSSSTEQQHKREQQTADDKKKTLVFGAEPSFSGANDAELGLSQIPPTRIPHVKSLTIADGLRTPVGLIPWTIISDRSKVEAVYSATEDEIKSALRLMMERTKLFVEPSAVVPLAVVLFCKRFREFVAAKQVEEAEAKKQITQEDHDEAIRPWDVGIILSGGNTTLEAIAQLFSSSSSSSPSPLSSTSALTSTSTSTSTATTTTTNGERQTAQVTMNGSKVVEDIAG